jgi:hypothetical protein
VPAAAVEEGRPVSADFSLEALERAIPDAAEIH